MSDALPRSITLIGRLKKEWSRISRDIYSESYTSRQEIVRFTLAPRPRFESMGCCHKRKAPVAGGFKFNGAAYRIRTYDVLIRSQTLYPAEVTPRLVDYYAHGLNNGQAFFQKKLLNLIFTHLEHLARSSMHRDIKEQSLLGALKSIDAAYRIPRIRSGFDRGSNLRNAPI